MMIECSASGLSFTTKRTKATKFKISSLINFLIPRALRVLRGDMRIGTGNWEVCDEAL